MFVFHFKADGFVVTQGELWQWFLSLGYACLAFLGLCKFFHLLSTSLSAHTWLNNKISTVLEMQSLGTGFEQSSWSMTWYLSELYCHMNKTSKFFSLAFSTQVLRKVITLHTSITPFHFNKLFFFCKTPYLVTKLWQTQAHFRALTRMKFLGEVIAYKQGYKLNVFLKSQCRTAIWCRHTRLISRKRIKHVILVGFIKYGSTVTGVGTTHGTTHCENTSTLIIR